MFGQVFTYGVCVVKEILRLEFLNSFVMNFVSLLMYVNLVYFVWSLSFSSHLIIFTIEVNLFKSDVSY
jgi:hypothetical protein